LNISGQNGEPPLAVRVAGCEEQPCVVYLGGDVSTLVDFRVCKINCFFGSVYLCTFFNFVYSWGLLGTTCSNENTVKRKLVHKCMRGGQGLGSQGTLNPQWR